tara:strand:+ start:75924 stop:76709 length:786 start_codon:yes stop_codon:yes gene_type:complete
MRIISWNINSVRLRIDHVTRLVSQFNPDVLCLQEIKVTNENYPLASFKKMGFDYNSIFGQKGYHGVSTHSKFPITKSQKKYWCNKKDSRHLITLLDNEIELHNFYIPAGGEIPDPKINEKFAYKLNFLDELAEWSKEIGKSDKKIMLGDLNVAPLETDVWSHKKLLTVVSHTPEEVNRLNTVMEEGKWIDAVRKFVTPEKQLYSWWSYRNKNWEESDKGRRLDHMWVTKPLEKKVKNAFIEKSVRHWDRPSDHAPVIVDFI